MIMDEGTAAIKETDPSNEGVKISADEIICDKCNGTGFDNPKGSMVHKTYFNQCSKCYGSGKLTWIENAIGKDSPPFQFCTSYTVR